MTFSGFQSIEEREIILVGTAHISQESVDLVRNTIISEKPDCVCVELDENRLKALDVGFYTSREVLAQW